MCDVLLPYLESDNSSEKKLIDVSAWAREWAAGREDLVFNPDNCNRSYTRFTTPEMTGILPDLPDAPSAWNTETHYFYEIHPTSSGKVYVQLSINSKNITDEYRAICDNIQKLYPSGTKEDWNYRIPFKSKQISTVELGREQLFEYLDHCLHEIRSFEEELKRKLSMIV